MFVFEMVILLSNFPPLRVCCQGGRAIRSPPPLPQVTSLDGGNFTLYKLVMGFYRMFFHYQKNRYRMKAGPAVIWNILTCNLTYMDL